MYVSSNLLHTQHEYRRISINILPVQLNLDIAFVSLLYAVNSTLQIKYFYIDIHLIPTNCPQSKNQYQNNKKEYST